MEVRNRRLDITIFNGICSIWESGSRGAPPPPRLPCHSFRGEGKSMAADYRSRAMLLGLDVGEYQSSGALKSSHFSARDPLEKKSATAWPMASPT